jgi:hypothetical protein
MPINDGRPEPSGWQYNRDGLYEPIRTMTLRQCYAGQQMAALRSIDDTTTPVKMAMWAVADADALIAELEKGTK